MRGCLGEQGLGSLPRGLVSYMACQSGQSLGGAKWVFSKYSNTPFVFKACSFNLSIFLNPWPKKEMTSTCRALEQDGSLCKSRKIIGLSKRGFCTRHYLEKESPEAVKETPVDGGGFRYSRPCSCHHGCGEGLRFCCRCSGKGYCCVKCDP